MLPAQTSVRIPIQDPNQVAQARRMCVEMGRRALLEEETLGRLGIVVTELATNLVKHAGGGDIVARVLGVDAGIEILSIDRGPGIRSTTLAFEDGYSTSGSAGTGLGAIARLSSSHAIYSASGAGTVLMARLLARKTLSQQFEAGVICLPKPGEEQCGDSFSLADRPEGWRASIADGLGHGPLAREASAAAMRILAEKAALDPVEVLMRIHEGIRSTRGAAVAVADINREKGTVRFCGVGNIACGISGDFAYRQTVSMNGTAGHNVRKLQPFEYEWSPASLLIMHSDGLGTSWSLDRYPGLRFKHPSLIAGTLFRDFTRGRDDVTVLVTRQAQPAEPQAGRGQ